MGLKSILLLIGVLLVPLIVLHRRFIHRLDKDKSPVGKMVSMGRRQQSRNGRNDDYRFYYRFARLLSFIDVYVFEICIFFVHGLKKKSFANFCRQSINHQGL